MGEVAATAQPNVRHVPTERRDIPPGWMTNPSEPDRRFILAALATLGLAIAVYLTLYQTDVISTVWEPFFGDGSRTVLNSNLSRSLPVPDAALGAAAYLADALLLLAGGADRWRSQPWLVLANGATTVALGIAGLSLLIVQPTAYGSYCTLCLCSAFISISLVGPEIEEVLATLQHLARTHTSPADGQREPEPKQREVLDPSPGALDGDVPGIRLRHLFGVAAGLFLMAAPAVIDFSDYARTNVRVVGPIVVALSMLSLWPATRWFARLNAIAGLWLIVGTILFQSPHLAQLVEIAIGALLVALALFPGAAAQPMGGGWVGILGSGLDLPEQR